MEFLVRTLMPNFTIVGFKMWATASKSPKLVFFSYKFAQKGYTRLSDFFTKFGLVEGVPCPHPHTKFHRSGFKNVGLQPQKWRKITIFGINSPLLKNFWGP